MSQHTGSSGLKGCSLLILGRFGGGRALRLVVFLLLFVGLTFFFFFFFFLYIHFAVHTGSFGLDLTVAYSKGYDVA